LVAEAASPATVRARTTNAQDVKDALRRRHPALDMLVRGPGQWTTVEEFQAIDLLAFNAWAGGGGPKYGRVGYEVKVSRSDYRREVLEPGKRALAVAFCHEFYFAVPKGLLKPDEVAFRPPPELADGAAYVREPCPGYFGSPCRPSRVRGEWEPRRRRRRPTRKGPHVVRFGLAGRPSYTQPRRAYDVVCPTCGGKGYLLPSLAERACPTLWVPADVGLVEVDSRGCHVAKPAPRRRPDVELTDRLLATLVRHVSYRPDPRHADPRARDR
jgi:hypothetical protein